MTARTSEESHHCSIQTVRLNFRNPAEVICIRCHKKHPCEHFDMKPFYVRLRNDEDVITLSDNASIEPICTLERPGAGTAEERSNPVCGGEIEPTHQGWIFNSRCTQCGQPYLNLNLREFMKIHSLNPMH